MEKAESRKRVCIKGNETEIIQFGGGSFFALKFDESRIPLYRIKMLENLHCGGLLPMHFLREEQGLHVYLISRFCKLKDMVGEWPKKGKIWLKWRRPLLPWPGVSFGGKLSVFVKISPHPMLVCARIQVRLNCVCSGEACPHGDFRQIRRFCQGHG